MLYNDHTSDIFTDRNVCQAIHLAETVIEYLSYHNYFDRSDHLLWQPSGIQPLGSYDKQQGYCFLD